MHKHRPWLAITITWSLVALAGVNLRGGQSGGPERPTADDVIAQWTPKLEGTEDFQHFVASSKESPGLAACTFRVVGPSFERLWNHYAGLCGIADRYEARKLMVAGGTSPRGSYIVSDRATGEAPVRRVLSVFSLRTDRYAVTVTIQPDPNGKAVFGSITAVIP